MRRYLLLAVVAIAAIGAFVGYRMYQRPVASAQGQNAELTVSAEELYRAFNSDEVAAGKQYNDKVVRVSGVVREVGTESTGPVNVLLETGDNLGAVVCEFERATAPALQKGQQVSLQGFCAGFNLDVLLQRCATVE